MTENENNSVDRSTIYMAVIAFLLINIAIGLHFLLAAPSAVVVPTSLVGMALAGVAWFRLRRAASATNSEPES